MKNVIFIAFMLIFSTTTFAQKIDNHKATSASLQLNKGAMVKLCQLKLTNDANNKVKIKVDFGNTNDMTPEQLKEIKSEGYQKDFNNLVDALRYMAQFKWRLEADYTLATSKGNTHYFILKRR